jgi:hypothetical protein
MIQITKKNITNFKIIIQLKTFEKKKNCTQCIILRDIMIIQHGSVKW